MIKKLQDRLGCAVLKDPALDYLDGKISKQQDGSGPR